MKLAGIILTVAAFSVGTWAQTPAPAAAGRAAEALPQCPRPADMSVSKAVSDYHSCLDKKKKLCSQRNKEKDPACIKFRASSAPPVRFPDNPEDINPTERCTIYRDGSYRCVQNPVRFVTKDAPKAQSAPTVAPGGSAAPSAGSDGTAPPDEGGAPATGTNPGSPPSPAPPGEPAPR